MKKKYSLILFLVFNFSFLIFYAASAQAPFGINYQAVARDASGNPIANQTLPVIFNIHQSAPNGPISCSETQSIGTNSFGLFSWVIGSSNHTNFDSIPWGKHKYFLEVIVNSNSMGTTQFVSVPYAFHAHTADSVKNISSISPWSKSGGNIFPSTLSDNVGIGLAAPSGKLSVLVSANNNSADAFNVGHQGLGHAGVFAQNNPANDSATLVSYTNGKAPAVLGLNLGTGHGGVFSASGDTASSGDGLIGAANGHGKAVFGLQTGRGYGGAFWNTNSANDSAALVGMTNGLGNAGLFIVNNHANTADALFSTTNGSGNAARFSHNPSGTSTANINAFLIDGTSTLSGTGGGLFSINVVQNQQAGGLSAFIGARLQPIVTATSGTISQLYGMAAIPYMNGTGGVVTTAIGGLFRVDNGAGTINNAFGIYIAQPNNNVGITTNRYALVTDVNAGSVGIGNPAPLSALEVNGALATTIKTIAANTTLDNTAEVWYTTTSGITLTLPIASAVKNRRYVIVYKGAVASSINISPAYVPLALTGGTTVANNTSIEIISDGTNWLQIK